MQGSKIATNIVTFATKTSLAVATLRLVFTKIDTEIKTSRVLRHTCSGD